MKHFSVICFILCLASSCFAQRPIELISPQPERLPLLVLKWPLLTLADPETTIQLGVEYLPRKGLWSIQQEVGFGNFVDSSIDGDVMKDKEILAFPHGRAFLPGKIHA